MKSRHATRLIWLLLFMPGLAYAHSPIKGLNNFFNGALHPVFVPAHLLLLLAAGLFLGQQTTKDNYTPIIAFAAATLVGLVVAWFATVSYLEVIILGGAVIVGGLVAAKPAVALSVCLFIAALTGLLLGMDSSQDTLAGKAKFVAMLGTGTGIYFLLLYPMVIAQRFNAKHWQRTGVRILGSWITAIALLVFAFILKKS